MHVLTSKGRKINHQIQDFLDNPCTTVTLQFKSEGPPTALCFKCSVFRNVEGQGGAFRKWGLADRESHKSQV